MIKAGCVGFSRNHRGIFPALIRFFTQSHWTHCFITLNPVQGLEAVLEAGPEVQVVPYIRNYFYSETDTYELYECIGPDAELYIERAASFVYYDYVGEKYGNLQLLWFIYRYIAEALGFDVRKQVNWINDGVICSELVYWFIAQLGANYKETLSNYTSSTIHAEDLYRIIKARPDLFKLVAYKSRPTLKPIDFEPSFV